MKVENRFLRPYIHAVIQFSDSMVYCTLSSTLILVLRKVWWHHVTYNFLAKTIAGAIRTRVAIPYTNPAVPVTNTESSIIMEMTMFLTAFCTERYDESFIRYRLKVTIMTAANNERFSKNVHCSWNSSNPKPATPKMTPNTIRKTIAELGLSFSVSFLLRIVIDEMYKNSETAAVPTIAKE